MKPLTLRQKIGQMVMCGFDGTAPSREIASLIEEYQIGGVIYFAHNVRSVDQVAGLSAELQEIASRSGNLPLWISIDQEGGMVSRITEGLALMPGQMAVAAAGSFEAAYMAALIAGGELRELGINFNFAPVLDVNNNPDNPVIGVRSFGERQDSVAEFGAQAVRGFQDAGVVATGKHFPGHGDTNVDSHLDLPTIPHSRERIRDVELQPFRRAIAEGVDAIMSAHVYFPAFEPEKRPATLSHAVLTGLLREELGFEGLIVTDCMETNAICENYGTVEASVMAVEAGADLVLISQRFDRQVGAIEAIERAVREGRLSEARIDASVERLLALKRRYGIREDTVRMVGDGLAVDAAGASSGAAPLVGLGTTTAAVNALGGASHTDTLRVGCPAHRETARRLSEASITLVKDDQGLLPLRRVPTLAVTVNAAAASGVDEVYAGPVSLGAAISALGLETTDRVVPIQEVASRHAALLVEARQAEQIVIGTYNARFDPAQAELVRALHGLGKPLVVVALRVPYDLLVFPGISTFVAAYESRPLALQSAAKLLLGSIEPNGRLPVSLGERYPAGWRGRR